MNQPSYLIDKSNAALLIVDPQIAFGSAVPVPGVEKALQNMRRAATAWREGGGRVYITRHVFRSEDEVGRVADFLGSGIYEALKAGSPLGEFHPGVCEASDTVVEKNRFNALENTDFEKQLRAQLVETVVVAGLTTPICVGTTVDALNMRGFQVVLIKDACASQPMGGLTGPQAHRAAIARACYIFAEVVSTTAFLWRAAT